jgi:hypothetical protein
MRTIVIMTKPTDDDAIYPWEDGERKMLCVEATDYHVGERTLEVLVNTQTMMFFLHMIDALLITQDNGVKLTPIQEAAKDLFSRTRRMVQVSSPEAMSFSEAMKLCYERGEATEEQMKKWAPEHLKECGE